MLKTTSRKYRVDKDDKIESKNRPKAMTEKEQQSHRMASTLVPYNFSTVDRYEDSHEYK
jgi:hypothetical protein